MKLQNFKRQLQLQEWASQIKAQSQSGMPVKEWCEAAGIGYKNFFYRKRKVQEDLLESLEERDNKSQISELATVNNNQLPIKQAAPVFASVTIPQAKGAALTVWIGTYAVDIQNNADTTKIEEVLRVVSRL